MAHIAVITTGLTGILHASFELITQLEKLGHTISCLCPVDKKDLVESQGFKYVQLPEILFDITDKNQLALTKSNLLVSESIFKELKPDLFLIDEELHEFILIALELQIELKLLSQFFCHQKRPGLPPLRTSIIPGRGLDGTSLGIQTTWLYLKIKIQGRLWLNKLLAKGYRRSFLFGRFKKTGFPTRSLASRSFPSLFIHTYLPVLSMTMEELEFPHGKAKNIAYIGPMVYDKLSKNDNLPNPLKKLIEVRRNDPAKKLIYCSVSSLNSGDKGFLNKVIRTVSSEADWLLVLSLGGKLEPSGFEYDSERICILKWAPQTRVLEDADCCITHGGIHTIHECIHFKVPMLVYSGKKHDQDGNAARVEYHNLGLRGDKDNEAEENIKNKIAEVLTSDKYRLKLDAIHTIYKAYKEKNLSSFL